MKDWTPQELQEAVTARGLKQWAFRRCSMCGSPLFYLFEEDQVGIDTNCDCVTYTTDPQLSSWDNLAGTVNQPSPFWRMAHELSLLGDTQFTLEEGLEHIKAQLDKYPRTHDAANVMDNLYKAKEAVED